MGTVFERCRLFNQTFTGTVIKKCSGYEATDLPFLFGKEAWRFHKDDDGTVTFLDPHLPWESVDRQVKQAVKREKKPGFFARMLGRTARA